MNTPIWPQILSAIATTLAVIVALFKEEIIRLWRQPRLAVTIRHSAPDCHKTEIFYTDAAGKVIAKGDCFYFRIWVENKAVLPTSPRESHFLMAYSHPY